MPDRAPDPRTDPRPLLRRLTLLAVVACVGAAFAQATPTTDAAPPRWLAAQIGPSATLDDPRTLTTTSEDEILAFTDRPDRLHDHLTLATFASLWADGFPADTGPPNAVLTWTAPDGGVAEAFVIVADATVVDADVPTIRYTLAEPLDAPVTGPYSLFFTVVAEGCDTRLVCREATR
mgnify:CR=1 FL=1